MDRSTLSSTTTRAQPGPTAARATLTAAICAFLLPACGGGGSSGATPSYAVGGAVSGLSGALVLQDNGAASLTLSSNGNFSFGTAVTSGKPYSITVSSQPAGQSCTVANGSGTVTSAVTNVAVACTTNTYSISGTISGLLRGGLVLTDNPSASLPISPGAATFNFAAQISYGSAYSVAVATQPVGQTCVVSNGSGTVIAAVTNVSLVCTTNTYSVGGTVNGLATGTLVLASGADTVTVAAGRSTFTFPALVAYGAIYTVMVKTLPVGLFCTVTSGGTGTVTGAVTNVAVACVSGRWAWMSGSNQPGAASVFGVQGTPSATTVPGARDGAASWTDSSGNLWMFGGVDVPSNNLLNDLWKYDRTTRQWTWVNGSTQPNFFGNYGTIGVPSASNVPGARAYAAFWTDSAGNFWLFGGAGYSSFGGNGILNDLWKYNPSSGQWTWISGSNLSEPSGVYGTLGMAANGNVPGGRYGAGNWIDAAGNLWLFGGYGMDSVPTDPLGWLNDLWKFTPATALWSWAGGSKVTGAAAVYGTQGSAAPGNIPGARSNTSSWADASGNLWLFGGNGRDSSTDAVYFNDLWKYNLTSGQWTWVSGSDVGNYPGLYGTLGLAAAVNSPPAREYAGSWTDSSGNLWLFGGQSVAFNSTSDFLNDLWKFSPITGQWTWVSGSSENGAAGTYGTLGTFSLSNVPGARAAVTTWIDSSGDLWIFGGMNNPVSPPSFLEFNDLWQFLPAQ